MHIEKDLHNRRAIVPASHAWRWVRDWIVTHRFRDEATRRSTGEFICLPPAPGGQPLYADPAPGYHERIGLQPRPRGRRARPTPPCRRHRPRRGPRRGPRPAPGLGYRPDRTVRSRPDAALVGDATGRLRLPLRRERRLRLLRVERVAEPCARHRTGRLAGGARGRGDPNRPHLPSRGGAPRARLRHRRPRDRDRLRAPLRRLARPVRRARVGLARRRLRHAPPPRRARLPVLVALRRGASHLGLGAALPLAGVLSGELQAEADVESFAFDVEGGGAISTALPTLRGTDWRAGLAWSAPVTGAPALSVAYKRLTGDGPEGTRMEAAGSVAFAGLLDPRLTVSGRADASFGSATTSTTPGASAVPWTSSPAATGAA